MKAALLVFCVVAMVGSAYGDCTGTPVRLTGKTQTITATTGDLFIMTPSASVTFTFSACLDATAAIIVRDSTCTLSPVTTSGTCGLDPGFQFTVPLTAKTTYSLSVTAGTSFALTVDTSTATLFSDACMSRPKP
ncbi:hypothetical protein Pelo_878 [Pelomyxa schiedti]|nr:hypothetical protein Pelo_878 [Pelomyxa schiedti]